MTIITRIMPSYNQVYCKNLSDAYVAMCWHKHVNILTVITLCGNLFQLSGISKDPRGNATSSESSEQFVSVGL